MADKKGRCVVLAGGPIRAEELRLLRPGDTVWAADAGLKAARRAGLVPELCLGDWDSCEQPRDAKELIALPAEKDDTDTHHAARLIAERGFAEALLLGCLGGRLDHTLANLSTLLYLTGQGVRCWLVGADAAVTALHSGSLRLPRRPECYFSVFAAAGEARGVTLRGMKYPLDRALVTEQFPIGVSNEILQETGEVTVENGTLLLVYSKRE